ncbi:hypothetical protein NGF19_03920 [Streptomyces sp. RY43-2]|uniref:CdiI immunity protein domain-containing protein n=1 Tax=Streptomyces macrolidinus TaxID=2952607 RepID=A0ABT0Z9K6_9ACTN|nr:hypothetical protein [Streptomyces macrolidinus]MCN9239942.1 hypothetical protein [Streptomyces macrolidinus]
MNEQLEKFITIYLRLEQAYDTSGYLRPTLLACNDSYVEQVREGLSQVLSERSLSVGDYERLTNIEFPGEESLYEYLQCMYAYLFEDRSDQPTPPE